MVERWKTDRQEIPPLLFGLLVLMEVEQAGDDDKRRTVGRKKEKLPPAPPTGPLLPHFLIQCYKSFGSTRERVKGAKNILVKTHECPD